jgi:hypothetical protein
MLAFRRISLALLAVCISVSLLASSAVAAGPATVTVRVEGANQTLLPATEVTTTLSPLVKDGNPEHSCAGTSGLGALQLATGGNWSGPWNLGLHQYFVESIEGEGESVGSSKYYWSFWVNDTYQETEGACVRQLNAGDRALFFPICYEACPPGPEPTPLEIQAPDGANVRSSVQVTVTKYNAQGQASPAAGATITGGDEEATTDSSGRTTVSFSSPGAHTLRATAPALVRSETTVCVHNGLDGTCGTTSPSGSSSGSSGSGGVLGSSSRPYTGPYALVARATGLLDGHVYSRRHAPRVLTGSVLAHTRLTSVSIELRRSYRGRCHAYDGIRERFVSARCGRGHFFKVSTEPSFSYLLPSALAPGRYVLDLEATDAAGNRTRLARGTSRIVFYVG